MNICGVVPPMLVPAESRYGGVDIEATRKFVAAFVDGGVHGLFPCGANREVSSLTRSER